MPVFNLLPAATESRSRTASAQALINLYPEANADGSVTLYGTPGRELLATVGGGPIRGMFAYGNVLYVASGTEVYSLSDALVATSLGTIRSGYGRVYFASNGQDVMLVDGVSGYRIVAGVLSEIADGDFPAGVTWCDCVDGFYIVGGDGSQKFYKSALLDGSAWDALDFASAEGDPDALLRGIVSNREILLFGTRSLEFWTNTGVANFPFERASNAFVEQGCLAANSVAKLDSGVFWLGRSAEGQGIVWRLNGYTPTRISTHAEEYEISQWQDPTDAIAWTYVDGGHAFYVLTSASGDASLVYDVATGKWHQRRSRDAVNRLHRDRAYCYAFWRGMHLAGDFENGSIYEMRQDVYTDNGDEIARVLIGEHIRSGKRRFYGDLELMIAAGVGSPGAASVAPYVSCAYPLSASAADVVALGFDGRLTLSNSDQTGTIVTDGTDRTLAAFPTTPPSTFSVSTGKKVIEWAFTLPEIDFASGDGPVTANAYVITSAGVTIIRATAIRNTTGVTLRIYSGASMVYENTAVVMLTDVLTVGVEMAAGTFRVIANNSDLTLTANTYTPTASATHYMTLREQFMTGVNLGLSYSVEARTSFSNFTQAYAADATDLCGNTANVPATSEPQAVLSVSDDGGRTWHSSRARGFGLLGQYKNRLVWPRNGSAYTRTFKVEITDAVPVAITGARVEFTE